MSTASSKAQLQPVSETQLHPADHVMQLATGYMASISIYIVAKLGIADLLAAGPQNVSDLAAATQTHEDRLYRVLRALAAVGVFSEVTPRQFALTPAAQVLRSDVPDSILPMAMWMSDPFHFRTYAELMHTVRTGEITFDLIYGKPIFEYFREDPKEADCFHDAMTCFSRAVVPAVLKAYDFSGIGKLLDVACGHGTLLGAILKEYPQMLGMLFDLDHVIEGTRRAITQNGLEKRCELLSGDFFSAVPQGADAIIMKHIIHDWDDAKAAIILRNCRKALAGKVNAKILLVETVIPRGNEPHLGKFIDLEMMVFPGGRERTEEEFRKLFAASGLRLNRIVPTDAPLWVVEAVPA